jgi:hypothetical protein
LHIAADLYTAAFLVPKNGGVPANRNTVTIPTTEHVSTALASQTVYGPLVGRAQDLAGAAHAFHWPLEFPDVMAAGGFDIVLGNPPWERIKLQEQEFFAARDPEIAEAPNAAARRELIDTKLKQAEPGTREHALYEEFKTAKRIAEAASGFARVPKEACGRFPLTGRGDVNTYALFAELVSSLTSKLGRAGVVMPLGIATSDTLSDYFSSLITSKRLYSLFSMDEIKKWFPASKDNQSFCLLTIAESEHASFAFRLEALAELNDDRRRFELRAEDIARINPNTKTAPVFRSRADAELTAKIYARVPVLIDEAKGKQGNPWDMSFMRMFDMSNDSGLFRTAAQLRARGFVADGSDWVGAKRYLPLYEAKMLSFFDHRFGSYPDGKVDDTRALPRPTLAEQCDPNYEVCPRYWVPESEVRDRLAAKGWTRDWLMAWRDITNTTNERTLITAAFPRVGVGNKVPLIFPDRSASPLQTAALIGCLSSLALDYCARQKLGGTTLNFFILFQFPILPPLAYSPLDLPFIVPRVLELTYTSHSMAPFARDLGYEGPPFAWDGDRRAQLRAELDAWYARAYGLTRDELRYVLDPADVMGPDCPSETFRVLKNNEKARYGEYRTARLVLAAWDAQETGLAAAQ